MANGKQATSAISRVQRQRERVLREKYQSAKPTLAALRKQADYSPAVSQGEILAMMEFAAKVKARRNELGLSLSQLASRAGIDKAALSRLENGQTENPTWSTMGKVAGALGKRIKIEFQDDKPAKKRRPRTD